MSDLSAGWELVSRRAATSSPGFLRTFRQVFSSNAAERTQATVTWTVRHRTTGRVRRLTARTELEARVKITNGLFDGP
jgi:AraC-like DNA-binding protein